MEEYVFHNSSILQLQSTQINHILLASLFLETQLQVGIFIWRHIVKKEVFQIIACFFQWYKMYF